MQNFDYAKKYHYMLKYVVLGLPIILLIIACIVDNLTEYNALIDYLHSFFEEFRLIEFNVWYNNFLDVIDLRVVNDRYLYILSSYPLYILWVYIFDILIDLLAIIPRLAHKFISKFGGDY